MYIQNGSNKELLENGKHINPFQLALLCMSASVISEAKFITKLKKLKESDLVFITHNFHVIQRYASKKASKTIEKFLIKQRGSDDICTEMVYQGFVDELSVARGEKVEAAIKEVLEIESVMALSIFIDVVNTNESFLDLNTPVAKYKGIMEEALENFSNITRKEFIPSETRGGMLNYKNTASVVAKITTSYRRHDLTTNEVVELAIIERKLEETNNINVWDIPNIGFREIYAFEKPHELDLKQWLSVAFDIKRYKRIATSYAEFDQLLRCFEIIVGVQFRNPAYRKDYKEALSYLMLLVEPEQGGIYEIIKENRSAQEYEEVILSKFKNAKLHVLKVIYPDNFQCNTARHALLSTVAIFSILFMDDDIALNVLHHIKKCILDCTKAQSINQLIK